MHGNWTPAPLTDVIHDPRTDWCACEPYGDDRCGYRMLADTVITRLNPADRDRDEASLCIEAVEYIAAYVESLPCTCAQADDGQPCGRCTALGQRHKEVVPQ